MSTSHLRYNIEFKSAEKGFWVDDSSIENSIYFLLETMKSDIEKPSEKWIKDFYNHLVDCSIGSFWSCLHLDLDIYITSNERKEFLLKKINNTKKLLIERFEKKIDIDTLQEINSKKLKGAQCDYSAPINKSVYIDLLDKIIDLIPDFGISAVP